MARTEKSQCNHFVQGVAETVEGKGKYGKASTAEVYQEVEGR
jgi:hypothetical protein